MSKTMMHNERVERIAAMVLATICAKADDVMSWDQMAYGAVQVAEALIRHLPTSEAPHE